MLVTIATAAYMHMYSSTQYFTLVIMLVTIATAALHTHVYSIIIFSNNNKHSSIVVTTMSIILFFSVVFSVPLCLGQ